MLRFRLTLWSSSSDLIEVSTSSFGRGDAVSDVANLRLRLETKEGGVVENMDGDESVGEPSGGKNDWGKI